jgi:hypothetical protein
LPDSILGRFSEWIRRRLGLLRVFRIYRYDVRVSGIVLPPKEFRKKVSYSRTTPIQFEISFEEEPYFRTLLEFVREAETKYEAELRELVKNQERIITQLPYLQSPLGWSEKVSAEIITQETINKFLRVATDKDKKDFETKRVVKVPARPELVVEAVSFTPVDSFEVTEDKIKTFEAIDSFVFKFYRPNEEEEYWARRGEFLHSL